MAVGEAVVVAGASGYIGQAVVGELLRRGYRVIALVRSPPEGRVAKALSGAEICEVAMTDAQRLGDLLKGCSPEAVVSCIASRSGEPDDAWAVDYQANSTLLSAAVDAKANRFVLLSAICVQKPLLAFQHAKLAFERELSNAEITHAIVRPTAFFKSISGQVDRVRKGKPFVVFGDGQSTACKPISEQDLATFLADCITDPSRANQILPIGGPGPAITPMQQGQLLFELTGQPVKFRHAPCAIFTIALALLYPLGKLSKKLAAKAELARIGHYYATESMLVWNDDTQSYSAEATPESGAMTLREHYRQMLEHGGEGQELGDHRVF